MGKRSKSYYAGGNAKKFKGAQLQGDSVGYLCTFIRGKDRQAKSELFELLNCYADDIYGSASHSAQVDSDKASEGEDDVDISKALANQVAQLKESRKTERFKCLTTGVNHILFMRTQLENHSRIVYEILECTKNGVMKSKTRCLLRLLPVLSSCRADEEKIPASIEAAIDAFIKSTNTTSGLTYKTEAKIRNNTDKNLTGKRLIFMTADVVKEKFPTWKVNLTAPDVYIFIDVLKTVCCVSVVKDYLKYKKFNLQELAVTHSVQAAKSSDGRVSKSKDENTEESDSEVELDNKDDTSEKSDDLPSQKQVVGTPT